MERFGTGKTMASLKDISEACGLSIATVSKALRNHSDVRPSTIAFVQSKAREMGYSPNFCAQYLKTNRSYSLGVLLDRAGDSGLMHDLYISILQYFKIAVEEKGYDVSFINSTNSQMTFLEKIRYRGFDGVMILNYNWADPGVQELLGSDCCLVAMDYMADGRTAVLSDHEGGMRQLMTYIIGAGHRRIAYIYGGQSRATSIRLGTFYRVLQEQGISLPESYVREGNYRDREVCGRLTKELLSQKERPTCIVYPDDIACYGGIEAIREMGLSVPEDVSVAGYDGVSASQLMSPRLTTVAQDWETMGRTAAQALIRQIESHTKIAPVVYTIQTHLIEGQTVQRISADAASTRGRAG